MRENDLEPENFSQSLDQSLTNLQLPYVDLLLIHWNNKDIPFSVSIPRACARPRRTASAKHVGVANFTTKMLDEAWAVTTEPLVCNQIEMHPFINQDKVLATSKKHGMAVVAYCPIARGKVPGAEALERIGKAHGKSAAQVSLRYLVQMGVSAIPRTATPEHLKAELDVFDFKLSGRRDGRSEEAQRHQHARRQSAARAGVGYAVKWTRHGRWPLLLVSPVMAARAAGAGRGRDEYDRGLHQDGGLGRQADVGGRTLHRHRLQSMPRR